MPGEYKQVWQPSEVQKRVRKAIYKALGDEFREDINRNNGGVGDGLFWEEKDDKSDVVKFYYPHPTPDGDMPNSEGFLIRITPMVD